MSIGTLAARIMADASGIKAGMGLARDELKITRQAFLASATDADKLNTALALLESARGKGAFANEEQYAAAVAAVRAELDPTVIAQNALAESVTRTTSELQGQIATVGMSADELQQYQLSQQGATAEQVEAVAALQAQRNALQETAATQKQAADAVDRLSTSLKEEIATAGMSADEAALWKLEQQGATREALESVSALQKQRAAIQEQAAAVKRGKEITESVATAEEQRADKLRELDDLLGRNTISQETYNRALNEVESEKLQELGDTMQDVGASVAAVAGVIAGTLTVIGNDFVNTYAEAQDAQEKLEAAMRSAGTESKATMDGYQRLAEEMQSLTKTDGDAVVGMLQVAESLGVTGDAAERAVKNAIALGASLGLDADKALKLTVALEGGNASMLNRYIPALKGIKDPAEQAALAQDMLAKMFSTAEAEAGTYAGASAQLGNSIDDVKESFGALIAESMTPFLQKQKELVESFGKMDEGTKRLIVSTGMIAAGLGTVVTVAGGAVAAAGWLTSSYATLMVSANGAKFAQLALNTTIGIGYVAAVGAAAVAGYAIGTMLVNQTQWAKDAAKAYKEYAEGVTALQSREAKQREDALKAVESAAPQDRLGMLQEEMDKAGKNLDGLTDRAEMAKEEMDRLKPSWLSLGQSGKAMWQAQQAEYEELKVRAAEAGEWVNKLEQEISKTNATVAEAKNADAAKAFEDGERLAREASRKTVEEMKLDQAELRDEFADTAAAGESVYDPFTESQNALMKDAEEFAKKIDASNKAIDDTANKLQEEIDTYGMNAEEKQAYADAAEIARLEEMGATAEQIGHLKELQGELAELKRSKDALKATEVSIGAGSMGEAFDIARRGQEKPTAASLISGFEGAVAQWNADFGGEKPNAKTLISGFENAVREWEADFGGKQIEAGETPINVQADDKQIHWLERIANGIAAIAAKEGIVIEEVSL